MTDTKPSSRLKERVVVAVIGVLVLAVILGGAYYREDLTTYFSLHGWEAPNAARLVQDFVEKARNGDPDAADALDGRRARAVMKEGKITAISHMGERGPATAEISQYVPADVKGTQPRIRWITKVFGVSVEYADGHWTEFAVARTPSGLKIVNVADSVENRKLPEKD